MKLGFTNNQLKIIAMIAMLIDHIGAYLFPQVRWLRIIGRLAYPIFAYMIAEGCCHTRSRGRYLLQLSALALGCQLVFWFTTESLYQSVLVSFSLAVITIFAVDHLRKKKDVLSGCLAVLTVGAVVFVCCALPKILSGTDFAVDYGIVGVMLPVAVYLMPNRTAKLSCATVMLVMLAVVMEGNQWYGLLAMPLLLLYNGQRGASKLKYLFYIFYPAHLAAIYLIDYFA